MKHRWSTLRKWESRLTLPFPLQDNDGRCASVQQCYQHAGEQPQAHRDVATLGMIHQYPGRELWEARSLSNQVLCMIAEYHLTGLVQGSSSISPVLPEAAKDLVPPIEDYFAGGEFHGMRDVRVMERAKTLQIAAWLHRLDMAADRDETTSLSLEVIQHALSSNDEQPHIRGGCSVCPDQKLAQDRELTRRSPGVPCSAPGRAG